MHTHPHEHEVFVVEGQGVFVCEGQEYEFCDKYIIFVLPNEKHQFKKQEILFCDSFALFRHRSYRFPAGKFSHKKLD